MKDLTGLNNSLVFKVGSSGNIGRPSVFIPLVRKISTTTVAMMGAFAHYHVASVYLVAQC
jgi:hypothetical protein